MKGIALNPENENVGIVIFGSDTVVNIEANSKLLQNILDALLPHAKNLEHILLQTGVKHYVGSFESFATRRLVRHLDLPFIEDARRLPCDLFYYTLEDILFKTMKQNPSLTYSIHRPSHIFGFAAGNAMSIVGTLAAYAVICKREGMPLVYPGSQFTWDTLIDASDAELIAEQQIWACVEPKARNQAFNISNGDLYNWKRLWHLLAQRFGVEVPEYTGESVPMVELMQGKEAVRDKIVVENGLQPLKLADVGHWWFANYILNASMVSVSSMNKSRELGFLGWRNLEKSFKSAIDQMQVHKIIP